MNCYWRHVNGRTLLSRKGREFKTAVRSIVCRQRLDQALSCRVAVSMRLYPPDKRKRDIDNYVKACLDALTSARVWRDDSLVDKLYVERGVKRTGGCVALSVYPVDEITTAIAGPVADHLPLPFPSCGGRRV